MISQISGSYHSNATGSEKLQDNKSARSRLNIRDSIPKSMDINIAQLDSDRSRSNRAGPMGIVRVGSFSDRGSTSNKSRSASLRRASLSRSARSDSNSPPTGKVADNFYNSNKSNE